VIKAYTRTKYVTINGMLRARKFVMPEEDPETQPAIKLDAVEALVSLAIISAMNKADPVSIKSYRGVHSPRRSCREGSTKIFEGKAESIASAVVQFCAAFSESTVFQDCGFASSSANFHQGVKWSGTFTTPVEERIGLVMEIESSAGLPINVISQYPEEQEVLYRPSTEFRTLARAAAIALKTDKVGEENVQATDYEIIPCGQALTEDQVKRVSHFRLRLVQ
jgi:hypothetical protein